jgi:hypothetical protein
MIFGILLSFKLFSIVPKAIEHNIRKLWNVKERRFVKTALIKTASRMMQQRRVI